MVEPGHRAVDELARCRVYSRIVATGSWICVVVVSSPELQAAKRSAASGNAYFFMFSIIFYGFGRDSARVFPGLAGARAPAPPRAFSPRRRGGLSATARVARRTIRRRVARGRVGVSVCLPVPNGTKVIFFRHMAAGIRAKSRGFEKKINFVKNIREVWRSK